MVYSYWGKKTLALLCSKTESSQNPTSELKKWPLSNLEYLGVDIGSLGIVPSQDPLDMKL